MMKNIMIIFAMGLLTTPILAVDHSLALGEATGCQNEKCTCNPCECELCKCGDEDRIGEIVCCSNEDCGCEHNEKKNQ